MRIKTQYKKSEASRQQIIEAAIHAVATRGLAATSVSDIAAAAKMAKGAVHYHFTDKDELLAHVLGECQRRLSARVKLAWDGEGVPIEKIRRVLREMWRTRTEGSPEIRVVIDLLALAVHDPRLHKAMGQMFNAMRTEMVEEFLRAFAEIGLRPRVPAHVIPKLVVATLDGVGLHALFDPPTPEDEADMLRALEVAAFALFEL